MVRKLAQIVALVFIFTIPWENSISIGSLGSIARIFGLAAAGVWIISLVFQRRLRALTPFHVVVFIFLLYNIASIYWTVNFDLTFSRVKTYLQIAVLIWMLWDLIDTPELLNTALQAFVIGVYFAAVNTIYNFVSNQVISEYDLGRYSGGGQNAVELALIIALCLPIAWHLAVTQKAGGRGKWLKILNYSFIPLGLFAAMLTASRTALIAIIPGVIYILASLSQFKPTYRYIIFFIFIVGLFIGQSFVPQATLERLSTLGDSIASGDLGGRVTLWRQSFDIFLSHPLLGIGSGSLASANELGAFAHNTFISILTELGILGFLLFLVLLGNVFQQARSQPRVNAVLWLTVFATWVIGVQSLTWEYTKPTWFFLSIIAVSAGVYAQARQAEAAKSRTAGSWNAMDSGGPRPNLPLILPPRKNKD